MFFLWKLRKPNKFPLTHSLPMHPFSTHWKHQKNLRFSNVFMGLETGCIGNEWVKQKFHSNSAWCNWIIYHIFDSPTNHCVKSVRVRSYSGLYFVRIFPHSDWIRRDTEQIISPYSVWMRENAGKMRTRITSNKDSYYAVNDIWKGRMIWNPSQRHARKYSRISKTDTP